jgi:hypothetical protein
MQDSIRRETLQSLIQQREDKASSTKKSKLEQTLSKIHGAHDRQKQTIEKHKT